MHLDESPQLLPWTPWLKRRQAELRAEGTRLHQDELKAQVPMWREEWSQEVRDAAERRETIPLQVARSFLKFNGGRAAQRDLKAAANAREIGVAALSQG